MREGGGKGGEVNAGKYTGDRARYVEGTGSSFPGLNRRGAAGGGTCCTRGVVDGTLLARTPERTTGAGCTAAAVSGSAGGGGSRPSRVYSSSPCEKTRPKLLNGSLRIPADIFTSHPPYRFWEVTAFKYPCC